MSDSTGANLTYGETLLRALVLGRFLSRNVGADEYVGVMLPPTVAGSVANIALALQGKIPINLNYTASQSMIDSSVDQCGIRHVITSARVLDKFPVRPRGKLIMLEDVKSQLRWTDKLGGAVMSRLAVVLRLNGSCPAWPVVSLTQSPR